MVEGVVNLAPMDDTYKSKKLKLHSLSGEEDVESRQIN